MGCCGSKQVKADPIDDLISEIKSNIAAIASFKKHRHEEEINSKRIIKYLIDENKPDNAILLAESCKTRSKIIDDTDSILNYLIQNVTKINTDNPDAKYDTNLKSMRKSMNELYDLLNMSNLEYLSTQEEINTAKLLELRTLIDSTLSNHERNEIRQEIQNQTKQKQTNNQTNNDDNQKQINSQTNDDDNQKQINNQTNNDDNQKQSNNQTNNDDNQKQSNNQTNDDDNQKQSNNQTNDDNQLENNYYYNLQDYINQIDKQFKELYDNEKIPILINDHKMNTMIKKHANEVVKNNNDDSNILNDYIASNPFIRKQNIQTLSSNYTRSIDEFVADISTNYKKQISEEKYTNYGFGFAIREDDDRKYVVTILVLYFVFKPNPYLDDDPKSLAEISLNLTNDFRKENGLKPLIMCDELCKIGEPHCKVMYDVHKISHDGFSDRFAQMTNTKKAYENVAINECQDYPVEKMIDQWINSPGHRANMLSDSTHYGFAFYTDHLKFYGIQLFALKYTEEETKMISEEDALKDLQAKLNEICTQNNIPALVNVPEINSVAKKQTDDNFDKKELSSKIINQYLVTSNTVHKQFIVKRCMESKRNYVTEFINNLSTDESIINDMIEEKYTHFGFAFTDRIDNNGRFTYVIFALITYF